MDSAPALRTRRRWGGAGVALGAGVAEGMKVGKGVGPGAQALSVAASRLARVKRTSIRGRGMVIAVILHILPQRRGLALTGRRQIISAWRGASTMFIEKFSENRMLSVERVPRSTLSIRFSGAFQ